MTSPKGIRPPSGDAAPPDANDPDIVEPRRWLPSLIWIVPLIAALIGIGLVAKSVAMRGPTITISFLSAEGLEPGKTKVKYKNVDIGSVRAVKLSPNLSHVLATVELTKDAGSFATKDSRFWVVRPRVGAGGVSGLGTLLSGAYIGADAGRSAETAHDFTGLETPPAVTIDEKGHQYALHSKDLGSLDIGTPIFYRRMQVGQVINYSLDKDGSGVTVQVFVRAPYDQYVGVNTRWWHASGVNVQLDSSGFKVNTQSLATVMAGGLAFETPPGEAAGVQAPANAGFTLASDESEAMHEPDGKPVRVVMNFNQSLRGLSVGAPVDFRGIVLGQVTDIGIDYDAKSGNFTMPVTMNLYPLRLVRRSRGSPTPPPDSPQSHALIERLVQHGLRGQLRNGNLLTGQLYVALDMFPKAAPAKADLDHDPMQLPTVPNSLDELQQQVADITKKLNQIPFDKIGNNLNESLKSANQMFGQVNNELLPQMQGTLAEAQKTFSAAQSTLQQDSPLQSDVHQALQELTRTLQSLNSLSDYLERHPESLLRGKSGDKP
ncbi:MlaD family protein [Paraburkholderia sp. Ac-20347]|uniref:PqiB family protein n=1 Tax=Paraburkholderia sp. Ac-20347 TaxID=2703892 RepID=UPI00197E60D1|nr:MlaD family protein [Paraburkholderia sp. Ac-20347]MBN3809034.1 MCE family protein [Paraburkholderia sp. Ac-20347]